MPKFTAYDPTKLIVIYSGNAADPSLLADPVFEGVAVSAATHRVKVDLTGVEEKPALGVTVGSTTISAGQSVTVNPDELVSIAVSGESLGEFAAGVDHEIVFLDPGEFYMLISPISQRALPATYVVTVS